MLIRSYTGKYCFSKPPLACEQAVYSRHIWLQQITGLLLWSYPSSLYRVHSSVCLITNNFFLCILYFLDVRKHLIDVHIQKMFTYDVHTQKTFNRFNLGTFILYYINGWNSSKFTRDASWPSYLNHYISNSLKCFFRGRATKACLTPTPRGNTESCVDSIYFNISFWFGDDFDIFIGFQWTTCPLH